MCDVIRNFAKAEFSGLVLSNRNEEYENSGAYG